MSELIVVMFDKKEEAEQARAAKIRYASNA